MLETAAERLCSRGGRISARPTRRRRCGLRPSRAAGEAARAVHHAASSSASARRGASASRRCWRCAICTALRPSPGNHHPEFPRQARHADGARRPSRRSPSMLWTIAAARLIFGPDDEHPGAAQSRRRRARRADRRRHQRLGRRFAGDARSRQSRSARGRALDALARETDAAGKMLVERLAIYPAYVAAPERWLDPAVAHARAARIGQRGLARDRRLDAGAPSTAPPPCRSPRRRCVERSRAIIDRAQRRRATRRERDRRAVRGARRRFRTRSALPPTRCAAT